MAEVCAASSSPRKRRLRDGSVAAKRLRVVFADGVVVPPAHGGGGGGSSDAEHRPQRCLWLCDEKDTVTFAKVFRRMVHDLLPWERSKGAAGHFDAYLAGYKVQPQQTAGVLRDDDLIEVRRRGVGAGGGPSPAAPPSPSLSSSSSGDPIPLERRRRLMLSDEEADAPCPAVAAPPAHPAAAPQPAVAPPPPLPAAATAAVGASPSPLATGGAAAKLPPSQYGQTGAAAPGSPHPLLAGVLSPVSAVAAAVPAGGVDHMSGSNPLLVTLLMQQVSTLSHVVMSLRDEIRAASASPVPLATPRSAAGWPHGVASPPSLPPCPRCSHSPQG